MVEVDALEELKAKDLKLAQVIEQVGDVSFNNTHNVFEDLVSCILDMRIHYTPTAPAFRYPRLKKLLNGAPIVPTSIEEMPAEMLAELKMSHQKDESLKLWVTKWKEKQLDLIDWRSLTDEEVSKKLHGVKGIGGWTKQMILLFTLERPDIFPLGDYQLTKAMCEIYELNEDRNIKWKLENIAERWRPNRSLAVRFLWRWRELAKKGLLNHHRV